MGAVKKGSIIVYEVIDQTTKGGISIDGKHSSWGGESLIRIKYRDTEGKSAKRDFDSLDQRSRFIDIIRTQDVTIEEAKHLEV